MNTFVLYTFWRHFMILFCFVLMLLARLAACLSVMRDIINISTRMLLLLLYYLLDFITNFDLLIFPSFRISCHYLCRTMCHAILQYFAILQKYILYLHNLYTCDLYVRCVCVVWTLAVVMSMAMWWSTESMLNVNIAWKIMLHTILRKIDGNSNNNGQIKRVKRNAFVSFFSFLFNFYVQKS